MALSWTLLTRSPTLTDSKLARDSLPHRLFSGGNRNKARRSAGYRGSGVGLRNVDEGPNKHRRCYRCGREGDSIPGVENWSKARGGAEEGERDWNFLPCSSHLSQSRGV